ncbi:histidine kinase [Ramlibacter sp.]|uniref:sensor histidine kinase n=1 Tax=Ramlibacter sp. TaxID=1917967 RepID=UPI003D0F87EE
MRVLVIEDSELDYEVLLAMLAAQGLPVTAVRVETADDVARRLNEEAWDLVISDHHLPGFTSADALALVRALPAPPPFIIVSGVIGEDAAVAAMRRGADDYLIKGRLARLGMAVRNATSAARARRESAEAQAQLARSREQLRHLSQRTQTALDEERAAIAREVHDEVGGTLTAIRFELEALSRHVDGPQSERLGRTRASLAQAIEATQRILHNLRPPALDAGLAHALEWQVRQFRQRMPEIDIDFQAGTPAREPETPIALAFYRTCQEALTNIAKHARARRVTVDLHYGGRIASLEVSDDGCGLDASSLRKPGSLGLLGLAERARAAGGALDISSLAGRTTLMMWLPVQPEAAR